MAGMEQTNVDLEELEKEMRQRPKAVVEELIREVIRPFFPYLKRRAQTTEEPTEEGGMDREERVQFLRDLPKLTEAAIVRRAFRAIKTEASNGHCYCRFEVYGITDNWNAQRVREILNAALPGIMITKEAPCLAPAVTTFILRWSPETAPVAEQEEASSEPAEDNTPDS